MTVCYCNADFDKLAEFAQWTELPSPDDAMLFIILLAFYDKLHGKCVVSVRVTRFFNEFEV
jgi:hypothetical protein